jgi:hypothetical protein
MHLELDFKGVWMLVYINCTVNFSFLRRGDEKTTC